MVGMECNTISNLYPGEIFRYSNCLSRKELATNPTFIRAHFSSSHEIYIEPHYFREGRLCLRSVLERTGHKVCEITPNQELL